MRLTRVFVPPANGALGAGMEVELPATAGEHIARVLRLRQGAALTVFDGGGGEWSAQITSLVRNRVGVRCLAHQPAERESALDITLLQSLARGEKMDWIMQKATELGVTHILPLNAARSVVQIDDARAAGRLAHWRAVAASACEQCGRNRLPQIAAPSAIEAIGDAQLPATRLALAPDASIPLVGAAVQAGALALLVGPEGGLTPEESAMAQRAGFTLVRFGPRILRTETAAIAAIAALQALHGDLGA